MDQKICYICRENKPLSKYRQSKRNKDGYSNKCKECVRKYDAIYREKNALEISIRSKKFMTVHHDAYLKKSRENYRKNKIQITARKRADHAQNPQRRKLINAKSHARHPLTKKNGALLRKYKIRLADCLRLSEAQNDCCRICKQHKSKAPLQQLCVDHDHKTGQVRGLLCRHCNNGLAKFDDNVFSIFNAIGYLLRPCPVIISPVQQVKYVSGTQEFFRNSHLKSVFGITIQQYEWLAKSQDYLCPICWTNIKKVDGKKYMPVDHCHKTQNIRGILCQKCNIGIGCFKENVSSLQAATEYLQAPPPLGPETNGQSEKGLAE
jgi:hypothetical protein